MDKFDYQNDIFGQDSKKLVAAAMIYGKSHSSDLTKEEALEKSKIFVELGVKLGYNVAQQQVDYFVEIGSGMAIPSLTMVKMGVTSGEAFDRGPRILDLGRRLASALELKLSYVQRDFYEWDPTLPEGTFLIADKPRDEGPNTVFERDIIELAIRQGLNLAINPIHEYSSTEHGHKLKCEGLMRELSSNGYETSSVKLTDFDLDTLVLAVK